MLPPMESTWRAISSAVRCLVPLKTMCSMKWEMPFDLRCLIARAGLKPNADRSRADVLHLLGNNGEAVGQNLTANIADFFYHGDVCWNFARMCSSVLLFLHIWRGRVRGVRELRRVSDLESVIVAGVL